MECINRLFSAESFQARWLTWLIPIHGFRFTEHWSQILLSSSQVCRKCVAMFTIFIPVPWLNVLCRSFHDKRWIWWNGYLLYEETSLSDHYKRTVVCRHTRFWRHHLKSLYCMIKALVEWHLYQTCNTNWTSMTLMYSWTVHLSRREPSSLLSIWDTVR